MAWKYGMILVSVEDEGTEYEEELCELVELYDLDGDDHHEAFCHASVLSPEELFAAAKDVERDGINKWFAQNGTFSWENDSRGCRMNREPAETEKE